MHIYKMYSTSWFDLLRFFDYLEEATEDFRFANIIKDDKTTELMAHFAVDIPIDEVKKVLERVEHNYPFSYVQKMIDSLEETDKVPVIHYTWRDS